MKWLNIMLAGVLLVGAPAIVQCAVAQVAVSPAAVEVSLAEGEATEVEVVVTNEGTAPVDLFGVPLPEEGAPEDVGELLFHTEPGTVHDARGLAMLPEGRLFAATYGGGPGDEKTREYTPELVLVRIFDTPRIDWEGTTGLAWMPPEHAPEGHPEGTLWWMQVDTDCFQGDCTVELTLLIEGDLDGTATGRTVELVTGPAYTGPGINYDRGVPNYLAYDAEAAGGTGLFYYVDAVNEDIWAIDVEGNVPEGYPVPQTEYDPGEPMTMLQAGLDAVRALDGGDYLDTGFTVPGDERYERVVVADRWGRSTGVETPLGGLRAPDGEGELVQVYGVVRSRIDPSILYLAVRAGDSTDPWIYAIRAAPLPPRWLRVSPVAPEALPLAPGETDTLTVRLNAQGMEPGVYAGQVALRSGGPNGEEAVSVPVTLTVTEGTDAEDGAESEEASGLAVWPNPVWDQATVGLSLAEASEVRVAVYDVIGREVAVLHAGPLAAGEHALAFETAGLPAGLYLVRAEGKDITEARRVTLVR